MKTCRLPKLLASLVMLIASTAHADIQTWELRATVRANSSFMPSGFPQAGSTISVNYFIDTSLPFGDYPSIAGIAFNGFTSMNSWTGINMNGLHALNIAVSGRPDGVTFVSFNDFTSGVSTSYNRFLNQFSRDVAQTPSQTEIRFDFGNESIYAAPTSFIEVSSVPEPSTALIAILGLGAVGVWRKKFMPGKRTSPQPRIAPCQLGT